MGYIVCRNQNNIMNQEANGYILLFDQNYIRLLRETFILLLM